MNPMIRRWYVKTGDNVLPLSMFSEADYLVKNGKSMGIDPDNLVVTGSSAGAITV